MRRHRAPFFAVLQLAATCWLAAGPGGVVVRAVLACQHATMLMHMPGDGPCFCSQMVGAFDQALSVATPPLEPCPPMSVAPSVTVPDRSPFPLPLPP